MQQQQPILLFFLFTVLLATGTDAAADTSSILIGWRRFPTPSASVDWPLPRTGGATWQDSTTGDAWLFGGRAVEPREEVFGDLWLFRSRQRTWQQFTPLPGRGRQEAALCGLTNKAIVVVGGLEEDGALSDETAVFDLQNDTWRFLVCSSSSSSNSGSSGSSGSSSSSSGSSSTTDTIYKTGSSISSSSVSSNETWSTTESPFLNISCPTARCDAIVWCNEGALWVVGGNDQEGHNLIDVWTMDLASGSWHRQRDGPLHSEQDGMLLLHWTGSEQSPPAMWLTKRSNLSDYQLWVFQDDRWLLLDHSVRHQEATWPPARQKAATWTDAYGNLWMFGGIGISEINDATETMMDDIWMYSVSDNLWVEPEQDAEGDHPGPRAGAFAWADRQRAFLYGGYTMCSTDAKQCIHNDLWEMNVSYSSRLALVPTSNGLLGVRDGSSGMNPPTSQQGSMSIEQARSPWHEERSDVFGSIIFFGLSLSFFTIFGIVMFIRRCVSCPPREHALLKEPPPVRYTVIPDDTYTA